MENRLFLLFLYSRNNKIIKKRKLFFLGGKIKKNANKFWKNFLKEMFNLLTDKSLNKE